MDVGSILLLFALLVLVAGFVLRPLQELSSQAVGEKEREYSVLLAERDRLLEALAELDFDKDLGKIPEDIYALQRENLLKRGAGVLRTLDDFHIPDPGEPADELDEKIAARRALIAETAGGDPIEAAIAARKAGRSIQSGTKFCPACGAGITPGDKFCVDCGAPLT